jgi:hypothetical protein
LSSFLLPFLYILCIYPAKNGRYISGHGRHSSSKKEMNLEGHTKLTVCMLFFILFYFTLE